MYCLCSDVSAPETSQPISTKPAEATKGDSSSTLGSFGSETSTLPSSTTSFTSSTFSLANFGAPGAGAKPGTMGLGKLIFYFYQVFEIALFKMII